MNLNDELRLSSSKRVRTRIGDSASGIAFLARAPLVTTCGLASILLFIASLTQDCFYIDKIENPRAWSNGFGLLMVGWLAAFTGVYSWLANPTLLIAWLRMSSPAHRRYAIGAASAALLLTLSSLLHEDVMSDEAGNRSKITDYGPGYWLWIASTAIALAGSCAWIGKPGSTE